MQRLKGGKSRTQAAMNHSWLNSVESDMLVEFLLLMSDCGFPATHEHTVEYALEVAHVQHPLLPNLGKNWVDGFITWRKDQLDAKWSSSLESTPGSAVNQAAIQHWFQLLQAQYNKLNFDCKNIYTMDESGFLFGTGEKVKVIARKMTKRALVQHDGNHENVSVIVTICTNGSFVPPVVIFKGQNINSKW